MYVISRQYIHRIHMYTYVRTYRIADFNAGTIIHKNNLTPLLTLCCNAFAVLNYSCKIFLLHAVYQIELRT